MSDQIQGFEDDGLAPELDEGWWSSILGDEGAIVADKKEINCIPCETQNSSEVDWDCVKSIFDLDEIILLEVHGYNRGGLLVQGDGIQGFVPISHLLNLPNDASEEDRQVMLEDYVGRSIYLKVIECEPSSERVVFSERAAQAGEGKRKQLFETLAPGVVACGVITNVTDFGAFVDLGGVEGLIHVSEISWGRVEKPSALLKIGQQVKVIVLQVNQSTSRIALSLKRLNPNPWETLLDNYKPGDIVSARVTSIMRFGVFAKLEEGIEGLIHISSVPEYEGNGNLADHFHPGQHLEVRILHLDAERRRLGLGLVTEE